MTEQPDNIKILFKFHSNIFDEIMVETLWANVIDKSKGLYRLDNIPFYAPSVSSNDVVFAEYDEYEQCLTYRYVVQYSGNSVIQMVNMDKDKSGTNEVREIFKGLGCESEKLNDGYFSMEIPSMIDYKPIKERLDNLSNLKLIDYAEPCLSDKHRLDIDDNLGE